MAYKALWELDSTYWSKAGGRGRKEGPLLAPALTLCSSCLECSARSHSRPGSKPSPQGSLLPSPKRHRQKPKEHENSVNYLI